MQQPNILFVHVPKTAGKYVRKRFGNHIDQLGHTPCIIHNKTYDFKFSFIRNPWDRIVSCFYSDNPGIIGNKEKHIQLFREWFPEYHGKWIGPPIADTLLPRYSPQRILLDDNKNIMVDFIGQFENLDDDLNELAFKFNIKLEDSNRINISLTRSRIQLPDYRIYYTDCIKNKVEELSSFEINQFQYEF